jgi:hypothetical protein
MLVTSDFTGALVLRERGWMGVGVVVALAGFTVH